MLGNETLGNSPIASLAPAVGYEKSLADAAIATSTISKESHKTKTDTSSIVSFINKLYNTTKIDISSVAALMNKVFSTTKIPTQVTNTASITISSISVKILTAISTSTATKIKQINAIRKGISTNVAAIIIKLHILKIITAISTSTATKIKQINAIRKGVSTNLADKTKVFIKILKGELFIDWFDSDGGTDNGKFTTVHYGNGLWVAGSNDTIGDTGFSTSTNGIDWTYHGNALSPDVLHYANGIWVAAVSRSIFTSTDGINWTFRTTIFGNSFIYGIGFDGTTWCIVGSSTSPPSSEMATATDPTGTWTINENMAESTDRFQDVHFGEGTGKWVLVAGVRAPSTPEYGGVEIYTTSDPTGPWDEETQEFTNGFNSVTYDGKRWVIVGSNAKIYTAASAASSWSTPSSTPGLDASDSGDHFTSITADRVNNLWYAVTESGILYETNDPEGAWSVILDDSTRQFFSIFTNKSRTWVIGGNDIATDPRTLRILSREFGSISKASVTISALLALIAIAATNTASVIKHSAKTMLALVTNIATRAESTIFGRTLSTIGTNIASITKHISKIKTAIATNIASAFIITVFIKVLITIGMSTASITKQAGKVLATSIGNLVNIFSAFAVTLVAVATHTSKTIKETVKSKVAVATNNAFVDPIIVFIRILTATASNVALLGSFFITKLLTVVSTTTVSITKKIAKIVDLIVATANAIMSKLRTQLISTVSTSTASIDRAIRKILNVVLNNITSITKHISASFSAIGSSISSLSSFVAVFLALLASSTAVASITKQPHLIKDIIFSSVISIGKAITKTKFTVSNTVENITKVISKTISATGIIIVNIIKTGIYVLVVLSNSTANIVKTVIKTLTGISLAVIGITKFITSSIVTMSTTITKIIKLTAKKIISLGSAIARKVIGVLLVKPVVSVATSNTVKFITASMSDIVSNITNIVKQFNKTLSTTASNIVLVIKKISKIKVVIGTGSALINITSDTNTITISFSSTRFIEISDWVIRLATETTTTTIFRVRKFLWTKKEP